MKKSSFSKMIAMISSMVLLILQTPLCNAKAFYALAEESDAEIIASGECGVDGDNLTWTLNNAGELVILGKGSMQSGTTTQKVSWYPYRSLIKDVNFPNTLTSIGADAFHDCTQLTNVTIPEGVLSIGSGAFCGCTALTEIIIPNSMQNINLGAFKDCISLTNIAIPGNVTQIRASVFRGCSSLTSITIPESVTEIGIWAFQNCSSLTSVIIPRSVSRIWDQAFACCSALDSIVINNPQCDIYNEKGTISNSYENGTHPFSGIIYGFAGSTAEAYAKQYGRCFVALDSIETTSATLTLTSMATTSSIALPTDTTTDYTTTTELPSSTTTTTPELTISTTSEYSQGLKGDYNGDGEVTIADAVLLARYIAEDGTLTPAQVREILSGKTDFDDDRLVTIKDLRLLLADEEFVGNTTTTQTTTTSTTTTTSSLTTTSSTTTTSTTTSTTTTTSKTTTTSTTSTSKTTTTSRTTTTTKPTTTSRTTTTTRTTTTSKTTTTTRITTTSRTTTSRTTTTSKTTTTTTTTATQPAKYTYVCNINSKVFHLPNCPSVARMNESNKLYVNWTYDQAINNGYNPCGKCKPTRSSSLSIAEIEAPLDQCSCCSLHTHEHSQLIDISGIEPEQYTDHYTTIMSDYLPDIRRIIIYHRRFWM